MAQSKAKNKRNLEKRERKAKRRRVKTIRNYTLLAVVVAVAAVGAYFLIGPGRSRSGTFVTSLGNFHIPTVGSPHQPYNSIPPTSGPHLSSIARWGVHTQPIPDELQVHNLEDGGVVVQYNGSVDSETISKMAEVVGQYRNFVILAPYPDMESPIALTAWTRIQKLENFDQDKIERFIKAYRGIDHHVR